jgi:DNA polymerase (family 10)
MTNKEIANILFEIGDVLELKRPTDRFRFLAYRQAGQKIATWREDLKSIYEREGTKGLEKVPGVGEGIAEKIEELLKTGKSRYLDKIKKGLPMGELEFSKIPSVGPINARKLHKLTKAGSINELYRILKTKKKLGSFGEKTLSNVARGIEILKSSKGRHLISEVLPLAQKTVTMLRGRAEVQCADYVGSLRRMKETIGDIDIIAASREPVKTITAFVESVGGKVLARGEAKATLVNVDHIQIDLEILPREEYGSLLQHFTGSKEHNIAFRSYLQSKNLSFSEHGIKKLKNGQWPVSVGAKHTILDKIKMGEIVKCPQETDVYRLAGMEWVPPELREDRGEIAAALKHSISKLVTVKNIRGDLQMHSTRSDGTATLAELYRKAKELHYDYIAITDHSQGLGIAGGQDARRLKQQLGEIRTWNQKHASPEILASIEVDIRADGQLDMNHELLKELDIIVGSVHSSFRQSQEVVTNRLLKAIGTGLVDILGHPTGRLLGRREGIDADWPKIFQACVKYHVALEINSFPDRLDLPDNLIIEAKRLGAKFAVNTDAHSLEHLDFMFYGVATARRGWLEPKDIINTWPIGKLKSWLKR